MFIKNHTAMRVDDYLIVADLHIGITRDMLEKGVFVPNQSMSLAKKLNHLKKITKTRRLILAGDVKHRVSGFSFHEKSELEKFFDVLKFDKIIIVKGNHDGGIEKMLPHNKNILVKKSFTVSDYIITHGHANIKTTKKNIIIGHNQPHIKIRDDMGAYYVEPVWLRGRLGGKLDGKTLIIMPAFNEFCGATIVNKDKMIGPLAKHLILEKTKVYLLDGTDLGRLSDFMPVKKR
jgi:uncharacterized protein